MTFEAKAERLDVVFDELAALSNKVLVLETERDTILNSFTKEEKELWTDKVTTEYYETLTY